MHGEIRVGGAKNVALKAFVASLLTDDPNEFVLNYEFLNAPKQGAAVDSMHMHRGSAEIRFPKDGAIVKGDGEYYSGRDRSNQGALIFRRKDGRQPN